MRTQKFYTTTHLLAGLLTLTLLSCQQDKPKPDAATKPPKPKTETPCIGTLILRHAYAECQEDGLWHVVEDNYVRCREDNKERKFRVYDVATTDSCRPITPRPPVTGNGYKAFIPSDVDRDTSCVDVGKITISECELGMWVEKKYILTFCERGTIKLIRPSGDSAVATLVPCDKPVPKPAK